MVEYNKNTGLIKLNVQKSETIFFIRKRSLRLIKVTVNFKRITCTNEKVRYLDVLEDMIRGKLEHVRPRNSFMATLLLEKKPYVRRYNMELKTQLHIRTEILEKCKITAKTSLLGLNYKITSDNQLAFQTFDWLVSIKRFFHFFRSTVISSVRRSCLYSLLS